MASPFGSPKWEELTKGILKPHARWELIKALGFSEAEARVIIELGPEATIYLILTWAKSVAKMSVYSGKADPLVHLGHMATFLKSKAKGQTEKPGTQLGILVLGR